uniref:Ig-like domain-containing protein n=1 Tax=Pelusios castaneus TaxID=367368 RepID=A0A8C8SHT2_9SAUR
MGSFQGKKIFQRCHPANILGRELDSSGTFLSFQYAYDGKDFISFDNQTGTWVAAVQPAFPQKQRWETSKTWSQYVQWFLQHECLETLRSLLEQGRAALEQQVPPQVLVSYTDSPDGSVTLSCRARGFYPRPIHISWVRDGEDVMTETDSSGILPNADGTYYTQSSLEISPQQEDRHRYACRVEHGSLGEPTLIWVWGSQPHGNHSDGVSPAAEGSVSLHIISVTLLVWVFV